MESERVYSPSLVMLIILVHASNLSSLYLIALGPICSEHHGSDVGNQYLIRGKVREDEISFGRTITSSKRVSNLKRSNRIDFFFFIVTCLRELVEKGQ